jgi:arsenate reductase (thioredoxin)
MTMSLYNVLFLCTGNSARSIMAEAILSQLGAGRFRAYSAGSHPAGQVNPYALELLHRNHYKTEGLHSKNWGEFAKADAPQMNFVLTVCDKAAGEVCPLWPGQPMTAHWGVADPVEAKGDEATLFKAFTDAFMVLNRRIALLVNLPIEKLDRLALHKELADIGRQSARPQA